MTQNTNIVTYPQKVVVIPGTQKVQVLGTGIGPVGAQGPQGIQGETGATGPQGEPGGFLTVSATAPTSPTTGDLWYETGTEYTWVYDGTQWVEIAGSIGTLFVDQDAEIDGTLTANHIHGNIAGSVYIHVKNTSGVTIPAGSPVYATGSVGSSGATEIAISDADNASTMPALGIVAEELIQNAQGHATVLGVAKGLDTSTWSINDSLYVSTTGTLVNARPTGSSELVQKIGRVIRVDASTGEILVLGAGRTNDVPNGLSPTITLAGDASGSVTLTELGDGTLTVTVADDSHSHSYLPLTGGTLTGDLNIGGDLNYNNNAVIASNAGSTNIDHIWHDDGGNTWHFCSDTTYKATGNSQLYSGSLTTGSISSGAITASGEIRANGNISLRSGNSVRDSIYRVGGVYFTWDSDSYGTNSNHSIRSTYGDSWTDAITINSFGNVRVNIDSNSNGSNSFSIGYHTTGTANTILTVNDDYNGIYLEGWYRTYGQRGWYSQTYGGGWYMTNSTWMRVYNSKHLYTNGGKFEARHINTSNDWSVQSCIITSSTDHGYAGRSYDSDTHTGQLRPASGTWYVRNHNDGAYWTIAAVISNQSSRRLKQDIETWGSAKPLSSAVNAAYDTTATDIVKQLRPVTYRLKKHERLPRDIPSERRREALDRLNRYRIDNDLEQYDGEEAIHECGRDCDASLEEPCSMYANWERGTIGFIAEEVGQVIPEATDMEVRPRAHNQGENTAIDGLALTAVLTKALQEIEARLSVLESR